MYEIAGDLIYLYPVRKGWCIVKRIKCSIFVILILLNFFLFLPQSAKADENLTIPEWAVDAHLLETGDLQITEDITFQFNEYFNGVFREIVLNKTSGTADISVDEITEGGPIPFGLVENAENGDSGVFTAKRENEKTVLKIFAPSDDEKRTFRIHYTIKNVAVRYNDTAELYYKFIGDENATPIGRLQVNIVFSQRVEGDNVKVFAHGPLNGVIRKESDSVYYLYVEDVPPNTFVEGRVVFPKEFIPLSQNMQSIDNYANILEEEASFQRKLAADLERKRQVGRILGRISVWVSVFSLALFSLFLILFRREKNIYQNDEYDGRSIPEECSPAVAAYLTGTALSTNTIFATILDLVRRGYVIPEKAEENPGSKKHKKDYNITKNREQDDSLLEHEKHFMNWLFHVMGDERTVTTQQIETYSKERSASFSGQYYNWRSKVKADAVKKGYYDRSKIVLGIILIIVCCNVPAVCIYIDLRKSVRPCQPGKTRSRTTNR
jgi:uncharacterized membrane protein